MSLRASSGSSSLAARSSSRPARVSHWPFLVRLPPGSFNWSNSSSPSWRGLPRLKRTPGQHLHLAFEARDALREARRQPREDVAVDLDARALHVGEHRQQRPLQRLIDGGHAFGGEARLQRQPQPQRHVGVFGCVFRGLVDRYAGERAIGFFLGRRREFDDLAERHRRMREMALRQRIHAVIALAAIERVGQQHRVVDRRDADAVAPHDQDVVLQVLADLEDARIFEQRLQNLQRRANVDLAFDKG